MQGPSTNKGTAEAVRDAESTREKPNGFANLINWLPGQGGTPGLAEFQTRAKRGRALAQLAFGRIGLDYGPTPHLPEAFALRQLIHGQYGGGADYV